MPTAANASGKSIRYGFPNPSIVQFLIRILLPHKHSSCLAILLGPAETNLVQVPHCILKQLARKFPVVASPVHEVHLDLTDGPADDLCVRIKVLGVHQADIVVLVVLIVVILDHLADRPLAILIEPLVSLDDQPDPIFQRRFRGHLRDEIRVRLVDLVEHRQPLDTTFEGISLVEARECLSSL